MFCIFVCITLHRTGRTGILADSVHELGTASPRSPIGVPGVLGVLGSSPPPGSFCITMCVAFSSPFCSTETQKKKVKKASMLQ